MEKGFNDDELADIMNEIESLEQDFQDGPDEVQQKDAERKTESDENLDSIDNIDVDEVEEIVAMQEQEEERKQDQKAPNINHESEEVLDKLSKMPEDKSVLVKTNLHPIEGGKKAKTTPSEHCSMHFHVEGDMKVDLGFNISGQQVNICVNEEEGLVISLDSGAKFVIPFEGILKTQKAN